MVVYQLHAQAVRTTVWKNVPKIQNVPELRIPFTQIRSIGWKTAAEAWNWYQTVALKKWNTNSRLRDSVRKKTGLPFQIFSCSRKFSAGTTQDVLFHLLSNRIFWKLFENGKQPITAIIKNMESYFLSPKVSSNLPTQSLIDWLPFCKVLVPAGHALQLVICSVSW